MASSGKTPRGRQSTKAGAAPSTKKQARSAKRDETAATCAATTVKGTACRLKSQPGSKYCARHAKTSKTTTAAKPSAAPKPGRNGETGAKKIAKKTTKKATKPTATPPATPTAKATAKPAAKKTSSKPSPSTATGETKPRKKPVRKPTRGTGQTKIMSEEGGQGPLTRTAPDKDKPDVKDEPGERPSKPEPTPEPSTQTEAETETSQDDEYGFYGSEFSTTMEASPYDDLITPEMAEGEDDVVLRDENEFGRDRQKPQPPRLTREDAEKKALEKLGPRPTIAPEEDLHDSLVTYDQKFEQEVRRLLGHGGPRGRGRRGGRRRGGGRDAPRKRRGRRGGRGRPGGGPRREGGGGGGGPRRGGQGGGSRRSGPTSSAARKVGRDSPLAQKRPSKGPKGAMKPRRRRDPDV